MFGKVNRSFRTLNDCDMLCSGDAKCWHHVCSLFVTLLAQLAWWTIDRRTRHQGVSLRLGSKFLGLFLEAGKRGDEWVEVLKESPVSCKSILVVGYLQCAGVLLDECSAAPSGIRLS